MSNLLDIFTNIMAEDTEGDFLATPAVAYFCFDSIDFDFEKDMLSEDIYSDAKKEQKAMKKGKTSDITGTVYKLTPEQKRCLKYLKKKYGKSLIKEIKQYRKETLAPYQVAKAYNDKSKALYPKEVFGMTKEEYLRYKKSAEDKIRNMHSNKYDELNREMMDLYGKTKRLNDLGEFMDSRDISDTALNKVFKKYDIYSTKYSEAEMRDFQRKIDNVGKVKAELEKEVINNGSLSSDQKDRLKDAIQSVKSTRSELSNKEDTSSSNLKTLKALSSKIEDLDNIPVELKDKLSDIVDGSEDSGIKVSSKTFDQEYENFLMREKIRADVRDRKSNKYTDDYFYNMRNLQGDLSARRSDVISKMAKERNSKKLNDMEQKIYEPKLRAPKDSDKLEDYVLKIKESDFFDPKYYKKDEKFQDAERKVDAAIKRFERGLEAKMEPKDFQLLKKYRLISNLITIKNAKLGDLFNNKSEETKEKDNNEEELKEKETEE